MSAALVRNFFPSVTTHIRSQPSIHRGWLAIFPTSIEQLCPCPQISLQVFEEKSLTLRWPYASIFCLLGIVLGVYHATVLLRNAFASGSTKGSFTWGFAFLWYGSMSVGGLFYHCLTTHRAFYFLDVVSTACCSITIAAGCFAFNARDDREPGWRRFLALCYLLIIVLALEGSQIVRDLLYVVPAVTALLVGMWFVGREWRGRSWRLSGWLCCAILGVTIALAGLPLDAWLCRNLGSNWSCVLWFFMGSDIAICCIYRFVSIAAMEERTTTHQAKISKHKSS